MVYSCVLLIDTQRGAMHAKKSVFFSIIVPLGVLIVALLAVLGSCVNRAVFVPKARDGRLDLTDWSFMDRGSIPLDGEWEFYRGELVMPTANAGDTPVTARSAPSVVPIPDSGLWQVMKDGGKPLSPYGCATYRLTIVFSEPSPVLAVKIPSIFSAARVFLNGQEISSAGTVGATAESTTSRYGPEVVRIAQRAGENELLVQVSNYAERRGGFNRSFIVGEERSVKGLFVQSLAMDLIIFGSLLTIGLYHLCLFWLRKKDHSPLWFGLFCIIIALRSLIYGERFLFGFFPSVPWEVFNRLDHLTFYVGIPVFSAYIMYIFARDISRVAMIVYQALGLVFALFLFLPPAVFNATVSVYELITAGYVLYLLFVIFRALARKREGSLTTVIGIGLFLCFGVNEILFNMGLVNTFNSLSMGLVIFLFTQSILIAMRFSKAFDESEHLGRTLLSTNESLRRFIPQEFFMLLNRNEVNEIRLGDQVEQNMAIMFADIRGFTLLAEQLGAAKTFEFLNDYYSRVGEVIRENGGFVDKYLGDGFIALFPGSADAALKAAIGIQRVIGSYNASRDEGQTRRIEVGIGLNFGPLILGTVGEEHRMDTTVIADSVNLCSRLEGLSKFYGKGTIVPFEFLDRIENPDEYHWRYLGLIRVQGRKQPVEIAHVYDGLPERVFDGIDSSKERFEEALGLYRNGECERAMEEFRKLATENPGDPAIFTFMTQIQRIIKSGLVNEWDGIEEMPVQ